MSENSLVEPHPLHLIVVAGLPAAGKSTLAGILAPRLHATLLSVDPIEAAILRAGIDVGEPTGLAAYLVAEELAAQSLTGGRSVVVDAVNAAEAARSLWRDLAERCSARLRVIEVVCTDEAVHKERLEKRRSRMAHVTDVQWRAVEQSLEDYSPWAGPSATMPRITLDSTDPLGVNVETAIQFIQD